VSDDASGFAPNCADCAWFGTAGISIAGSDRSFDLVYLIKPQKSDFGHAQTWEVGICHRVSAMICSDVRSFGGDCGPMGKNFEEKAK